MDGENLGYNCINGWFSPLDNFSHQLHHPIFGPASKVPSWKNTRWKSRTPFILASVKKSQSLENSHSPKIKKRHSSRKTRKQKTPTCMLHMCFLRAASKTWWISVKNFHHKISCDSKKNRGTNIWATEKKTSYFPLNPDCLIKILTYNGPLLTITI